MISLHDFCKALVKTCFYKVHEHEKTDLGKFEPLNKIVLVHNKNLLSDTKIFLKHTKQCIYFYKKNVLEINEYFKTNYRGPTAAVSLIFPQFFI